MNERKSRPVGQGIDMSPDLQVFFWVRGLVKKQQKIKSLELVFCGRLCVKWPVKRL